MAVAKKLVADGVVLVVGHYCSGASIPASKVYEAAGVLQISPGSTNPLLTEQGRANVFRVIGRDDAQGVVAGNYLADHWSDKKIAILHDGTTYGRGLADETRKQLNKRGVTEAIYQAYTPAKNDYSAEIAALKAAKVTVVYVGGYHAEVALMVRAAHDQGYAVQFISGDALATEEFALIAGPAAEGTLFTFSADARRNPESRPSRGALPCRNFEPAGYTLLSLQRRASLGAGGHESRLAEAARGDCLVARQFIDTVLGRIDFDDKGDLTVQSWVWYIWNGGVYVPLE